MKPACIILFFYFSVLVLVSGCETTAPPAGLGSNYLPQTSVDNVLFNLAEAYRRRDSETYVGLLAEDYRFLCRPRPRQLVDSLIVRNRSEDSVLVTRLLNDASIRGLRSGFFAAPARPVNEVGLEDQLETEVLDAFLEIDCPDRLSPGGETTYLFTDEEQRLRFRRGRYPGDTDADSPTSSLFYITERVCLGRHTGCGGLTSCLEVNTGLETGSLCHCLADSLNRDVD